MVGRHQQMRIRLLTFVEDFRLSIDPIAANQKRAPASSSDVPNEGAQTVSIHFLATLKRYPTHHRMCTVPNAALGATGVIWRR